MYNAFFGFKENPFNLSPDPVFLYRSPQHEEALASLTYGVKNRKGFIVLTGEVGTGKTTMLECLRDELQAEKIPFSFLFNTRLSTSQFFEMIAYDLGLNCPSDSKAQVLIALQQFLLQQASRGGTAALLVDEAHDLSWDLLEEIRMLGNLENRTGKLLQVVLSGQPELDRKLEAPNLRQLRQRIVLRCELRPFDEEQTAAYIQTRMAKAGMEEQTVFPPEVLSGIYRYTRGIPRVINILCDNLLLMAFALEQKEVNADMLREAAADMRLTPLLPA
ncbi:MAG: AAA family ATPase [Bryobacteraceae bacterium]|nr:AAA family ATPase [Bryobacteraceae bacterium]